MKLLRWLTGKGQGTDAAAEWRRAWTAALDRPAGEDAALREKLSLLAATETDVEIEQEMMDALDQLRQTQAVFHSGGIPVVETHHRVIGGEPCHFTAPASRASDHAHTAGRVLLTPTRAVFVGGAAPATAPWHLVHDTTRIERDVVLIRSDHTPIAHYRFNTYSDAVVCMFVSRELRRAGRARL